MPGNSSWLIYLVSLHQQIILCDKVMMFFPRDTTTSHPSLLCLFSALAFYLLHLSHVLTFQRFWHDLQNVSGTQLLYTFSDRREKYDNVKIKKKLTSPAKDQYWRPRNVTVLRKKTNTKQENITEEENQHWRWRKLTLKRKETNTEEEENCNYWGRKQTGERKPALSKKKTKIA